MSEDLGSISGRIEIDGGDEAARSIDRVGDAAKRLDGQGGNALSGLSRAGDRLKDLEDRADSFERKFGGLGKGLTAAGLGIVAGLGFATKGAIDFESAMANVNSIAGLTPAQLSAVTDEINALSIASGKGPTELAQGLYDVVSSGFEGADAMTVLTAATNAANAGMTDTATSGRAISAVLNAYGLEAENAENVSDVLFQTVKSGVVTFEQLANNLGSVLPVASALGVPITEVGAAYAVLTQNGISAAESETALAAVMRAAQNPTDALTAAVQAQGYSSVEAMVAAEGLTGLLGVLQDESGGSAEKMNELLGSSEATTAALALTANGASMYTGFLEEMNLAMGDAATTQEALAIQQASTAAALQRLQAAFQVAMIQIGSMFLPLINALTNGLAALLRGFLGLSDGAKQAIAVIASGAGALALLTGGALLAYPQFLRLQLMVGNLATQFPKMAAGIRTVGVALRGLLLNPVALVAIAAFLAYQTNFLGFGDAVRSLARAIGELDIVQSVVGWFQEAAGVVSGFVDAFGGFFGAIKDQGAEATEEVTRQFDGLNETVQNADGTTSYFYTELQDDGTYKRVGEIVDSVANADGTTAEVLIKTDDGEYWATVDLVTGEIVGESTVTVTAETEDARSNIERLNDGVKAFTDGLRAINGDNTPAWIVSLAAGIDGAMASVNRGVEAFGRFRDAGLNPVAAAVSALGAVFPGLAAPLEAIGTKIQILSDLFSGFRAAGMDPLTAGLSALGSVFPVLSGVIDPLISAVANLGEAFSAAGAMFSAAFRGDWSGMAGSLNDLFENLGETLEDVGSAIENFGDLGQKAMNGLAKKVPALSRTFEAVGRVVENMGDLMGDTLGVVGDLLQGNFAQAFQGVGNVVRGLGSQMLNLGSLIGSVVADAAGLLRSALGAAFDWLASKAGDFGESVSRLGGVFDGILGIVEGLASAIAAAFSGDWGGVWDGLLSAGQSAFQAIGQAALLVPQLIIDAFQAIPWGSLASGAAGFFSGLSSMALDALQGMSNSIQAGLQLAWDAITDLDWGSFIPGLDWLVYVGKLAWDGFVSALDWIGSGILTILDWASYVGEVAWGAWLTVIDWGAYVGKLLWSGFLTILDWASYVGEVAWGAWITVLSWGQYVGQLAWSGFLTALDWAVYVGEVAWGAWLTVLSWGDYIGDLLWSGFVSALEWVDYIADLAWGTWLTVLSWSSFVADLLWSGFVSALEWSGFISLLDWIGGGLVSALDWLDVIPNPFEGIDIPEFPGWSEVFGFIPGVGSTVPEDASDINGNGSMRPQGAGGGTGNPLPYAYKPGKAQGGSVNIDTSGAILALQALELAIGTTQQRIVDFVAATIGVMGGWQGGISTIVAGVVAPFQGTISGATSAGKQSFITFVADTIAVMGGWSGGIAAIVAGIIPTFQGTISGATSAGKQSFITFVADTIAVMGGWAGGIASNTSSTMSTFRSTISSGTSTGKQSFITFVSDTIAVMGGWSSGIQNIVSNASSRIKSELTSASSTGSSQVRSLATNTQSSATQIASAGTQGGNGFRSGISSGFSGAVGIAQGAAGQIAGALSGLAGTLGAIGRNAGEALAAGLRSAIGSARAAANELAAIAAQAAESRLEVSSPSRVFIRIGQHIVGGLVRGIQRSLGVAERMAGILADRTLAGFGAAEPVMAAAISPTAGSLANLQLPVSVGSLHSAPGDGRQYRNMPAGPVTNVNYTILTIPSDDWVRVVEQAENAPSRAVDYLIRGYDSTPQVRR
jgi:TP901 family phage tail tape measure protein